MNDQHQNDHDSDEVELEAAADFEEAEDERHMGAAPPAPHGNVIGRMLRRLWALFAGPR